MKLLDFLLIFELSVIYLKLNELLDANKLTMALEHVNISATLERMTSCRAPEGSRQTCCYVTRSSSTVKCRNESERRQRPHLEHLLVKAPLFFPFHREIHLILSLKVKELGTSLWNITKAEGSPEMAEHSGWSYSQKDNGREGSKVTWWVHLVCFTPCFMWLYGTL